MRLVLILWWVAVAPLLLGEHKSEKSLEQLREEIVSRRTTITFADQSTATVIVEDIKPTSLSLRIVKTSNAQMHPLGKAEIAISSISKLTYKASRKLHERIVTTFFASLFTAGILSRCAWELQPYAVAVGGASSSQTPLVVTELDYGCEE